LFSRSFLGNSPSDEGGFSFLPVVLPFQFYSEILSYTTLYLAYFFLARGSFTLLVTECIDRKPQGCSCFLSQSLVFQRLEFFARAFLFIKAFPLSLRDICDSIVVHSGVIQPSSPLLSFPKFSSFPPVPHHVSPMAFPPRFCPPLRMRIHSQLLSHFLPKTIFSQVP